ncbi:hypothetical protein [Phytohabitans rumicis]|uniref:hypothetical protein n=1 Tax=Phytohabitans rumicis TaxID=1076125 RepID=UPI001567BCB6|nr:hypothetical protein [Phytohabitans rumicis]
MPLDMAARYAVPGALRRELEPIARVTARIGTGPRPVLRASTGSRQFELMLRPSTPLRGDRRARL